jgi:hypothetical protein
MTKIEVRRRRATQKRWITCYHGGDTIAVTSQTATAGRVMLALFEVTETCIADQIVFCNAATVAGNVIVGIYGPVVTEDTCEGAPVKVQSASTAQANVNVPQPITIADTVLTPGRYYAAIEFSDNTATYMRTGNQNQVTGFVQLYDRSGGYGALTDPCPTPTGTGSACPGFRIRVRALNI